MTIEGTSRVSIQPAGMPGVASLELRGTVLIYRRRSWVAAFSAYLPVEWIEREDARRFDWQRLWQGIIALLIAVLFALPLSLCARFRVLIGPADLVWMLPLAFLLAGALALGCQRIASFCKRRACTQLRVPGGGRALGIRFWRDAGGDTCALEAVLDALTERSSAIQRGAAPPIHINHGWYQPDPYRMAFFKGLVISFFLYLALLAWGVALLLSGQPAPPFWIFAILAAPPLFHLAGAFLRDLEALRAPAAFRSARRHFRRGALEASRDALDTALEHAPEELPARVLMVRVCAELGRLEEAQGHCAKLGKERPAEAAALEESLWAMRRLHTRMEEFSSSVE